MLTVKETSFFPPQDCAVCLGNFDGLHIGHRELIKRGVEIAKREGLKCAVLSFEVHPAVYLSSKSPELLISFEEKERILSSMGVDYFVLSDFSSIRDMSCEDYVDKILIKRLSAAFVICGFNYSFGKRASGDAALLRELLKSKGVRTEIVDEVRLSGQRVSSTAIRELLKNGDCELAARLLGGSFCIDSPVTAGKRLGRTLGFPTANQRLDPVRLKPKKGVYASTVSYNGRVYAAISNLGERPTVEDNGQYNCESFILGFNGDIYGCKIRTELLKFIREEKKFSSTEELREQIEKDLREVREYFEDKDIGDITFNSDHCFPHGLSR